MFDFRINCNVIQQHRPQKAKDLDVLNYARNRREKVTDRMIHGSRLHNF